MGSRIRAFFERLPVIGQISLPLVIGLIASLICLYTFAKIAPEVAEQDDITVIDMELANELHRQMTPETTLFYRGVSWIGMQGVLVVSVLVVVYFLIKRQRFSLIVWGITLIGGFLLNTLIKQLFARPRPTFADPIAVLESYSFPSGHAMLTLIMVGMLTYFAWRRFNTFSDRAFAIFTGVLLIVLVGISRMALGVHYLTDVIAGYAAGGVWLLSCIAAAARFGRKDERITKKA